MSLIDSMNFQKRMLVGGLCVVIIAFCGFRLVNFYRAEPANAGPSPIEAEVPPPAAEEFNPRQVVNPFPAITNAPVATAEEVSDRVEDNELVLGVALDGEARAYPINMLTGPSREIINDTLAGREIAATW